MLSGIASFFKVSNLSVYLIIGSVLVYGYFRIDALKSDNENLETQVETAIDANESLKTRMTNFENTVMRDLNQQQEISEQIEESNRRNALRMDEIYDTFNISADGSERDLEALSIAKPGLIERRINDATLEVFENVEENSTIRRDFDTDSSD